MKNVVKLSVLVLFMITSQMTYANKELPTLDVSFKIEKGTAGLEMNNIAYLTHFIDIHFDDDASHLSMTAKNEVSFIQILDEKGDLEFQLPIFSKKITIDVNDFLSGSYSIFIMIEGEPDSVRSTFIKN